MTGTETRKLLMLVASGYPNFRLPESDDELTMTVRVWQMALADVPYGLAEQALLDYIRTPAQFAPSAGQLRHLAIDRSGLVPGGEQAWEMVLAHIRRTSYIDSVPLDAPPPVLAAVKAMGGIRALRVSENPGADRHAFLKMYEQYADRAKRDIAGDELALARPQELALEA